MNNVTVFRIFNCGYIEWIRTFLFWKFVYLVKPDKKQLTFHEYMLGKHDVKQRKNN